MAEVMLGEEHLAFRIEGAIDRLADCLEQHLDMGALFPQSWSP